MAGAAGAATGPLAADQAEALPAQSALVEAARRNRERIEASRQIHGSAPRFEDGDLLGAPRFGQARPAARTSGRERDPAPATAAEVEYSEDERRRNREEWAAGVQEDEEDPNAAGNRARALGEREALLRERLLDIESSLTAIGASGLPYASRNPNRFQSAYDFARLRAEYEDIERELSELMDGAQPPPGS